MRELSIITQNLNGRFDYKSITEYTKVHKANIYAFQELKSGKSYITDILIDDHLKNKYKDSDDAKKLWEDAFPWLDFKSGYWKEWGIEFAGKKIRIINVHCSPTYTNSMRYTLLKMLDESNIKNELVILLGDFNAAFKNQTETNIKENHKFLSLITQDLKYKELLANAETENKPHFTFQYKGKRKKLDHIFISEELFKFSNAGWNFLIEYIDSVNLNFSKSKEAFTDHSGIKLTIRIDEVD